MFVHPAHQTTFLKKTDRSSFRFDSEAELKSSNVEYQDKNTYSCVINNPISNQTQHNITISQLCQPCSTLDPHSPSEQVSPLKALISAAVGSLLIVAVIWILWIYRKYRRADQEVHTCIEEVTYAETMFFKRKSRKLKVKEEDSVEYVRVVMR
ncbi:hypothetical protein QQF64_019540 [Cirrhinus molitorella]|uniref:Uncharacterized protein n=1 Tax=Cirrhinus molitorella TaxID=172907 RepID=A0ABR3LJ35_9TELE